MDHFQQSCQDLDQALRLAAIGATPHGVARVVLLYHQAMYMTAQTCTPCIACLKRGVSLEQVKRNAAKLDEQRRYYAAHIAWFGKQELHALLKTSQSELDISSLCDACLATIQQQLGSTFRELLRQQGVQYHVRRKKRSVPANMQERSRS